MKALFFILLSFANFYVVAQNTIISESVGSVNHIDRPSYSLDYPGSWTVDTSKLLGMDLMLYTQKSDNADIFRENLNVFVQDLKGKGYDLNRMGTESENHIKNMITDLEILESRLNNIPSQQYYILKYKGRQGKFIIITEQRYYLKNEVGFAFTLTTLDGKEEIYRKEYDFTLNSIKIK